MAIRNALKRLRRLCETTLGRRYPLPSMRWQSYSSCREYDLCPRRFRFAYVERLRPDRLAPEGWRYGTVVHRALEAAYRSRAADASASEIQRAAIAALHEAWDAEHLPDDAAWRAQAERLVLQTISADLLQADDILGIEYRFGAPFDDVISFAGYADLVLRRDEHTIEIVDHKVTRNVLDANALQHDPQLNLYGWLAKREWPWVRRVIATQHYPPAATTTTVDLTDASMEQSVRALFAIAHRAVNDHKFRPTPGDHCSSCSWTARCPAGRDHHEAG